MGGRGTFAAGNPVPYTYEAVGNIEGVKVLQGLNGKHGLPEEAHSSKMYIKLHRDGTLNMLRIYNCKWQVKIHKKWQINFHNSMVNVIIPWG